MFSSFHFYISISLIPSMFHLILLFRVILMERMQVVYEQNVVM